MVRLGGKESIKRSETGMLSKVQRGFTLIELLVVIVIALIISGAALLAFGDFGVKRKIIASAEHLKSFITTLQQKAVLQNTPFGIKITSAEYQVYQFSPPSHWRLFSDKNALRRQFFPKNMRLSVKSELSYSEIDIMVNPSGGLSAFELIFGSPTEPNLVMLTGKANGELSLKFL